LLTFFGEAKKVSAPPGAIPANVAQKERRSKLGSDPN
jgi:hypothetical protein